MSELKAHSIIGLDGRCNRVDNDYYLKSEADKVIAELEKEKEYVIEQTAEVINGQEKELRRQKHKRCLAMARIAQDDWRLHNSFYAMGHQEFEKRKCEFYEKWRKRWLKIAEKFKETK